ncbi:MAG: sensor histidine kinase [Sphingobacteriales bacterium]|nr:sensor histidine kinase [Sphingobacteriales bacterium]OJY92524.1 MAG: hypothetical protein BGP14_15195 [Sphingobacteriales bacterium 44-15]
MKVLPHYTSMDYRIMPLVTAPFIILINSAIFGSLYFTNWKVFLLATICTGIAISIDFIFCGGIAVYFKARFPLERQIVLRLGCMIAAFWLTSALFLYGLFRGYEVIHFFGYRFNETGFVWSCLAWFIMNVFITFLMEGVARYERWRDSMKETEELSRTYNEGRLIGLKSQVNPHFLFNSLNSLSSLIHEDDASAEKFLNEMSKVYRYMLRNEEDQLVTLQTELNFIESYIYLLKVRYGDGLIVIVDVDLQETLKRIPPLTLQVIIENAFSQNIISKESPLRITVKTMPGGRLVVKNNIQQKILSEEFIEEEGLDNLVNKYRLLNQPQVIIRDASSERTIIIPLIPEKEEVEAI